MVQAIGREIRRPGRRRVPDPPASYDGQQTAQHQRYGSAGKRDPAGAAYVPAERIRLAEISRSIVDHNLMAATSSSQQSHRAHVMSMDFELDQMIHGIPPFFQLDSYERNPDSNKASGIFIQAYLLNSLMHTQRCKLHLAILKSGPKNNPAYAFSRDICLKSARQIIRAEAQLIRSQYPFMLVRLRLAAILYSVFLASIVLLMDACINRPSSLQDEILNGDIAQALRMIEDARSYSLAAANLHESLMQILTKASRPAPVTAAEERVCCCCHYSIYECRNALPAAEA